MEVITRSKTIGNFLIEVRTDGRCYTTSVNESQGDYYTKCKEYRSTDEKKAINRFNAFCREFK